MPIPSASQVATTQNYISSANFIAASAGKGAGLHKPEVSEDFIKRYGSQNLTGFLDVVGAKAPVSTSNSLTMKKIGFIKVFKWMVL